MKLRIQGNVLRFRLTQKEVACLHDHNLVESAIHFPSGRALRYVLDSSSDASAVSAEYEGDSIRIVVPREMAVSWAQSSDVAIDGLHDPRVGILIEKDFQCLHKSDEQNPDAFPNPLARGTTRSAARR
jgi:hypothetical protein